MDTVQENSRMLRVSWVAALLPLLAAGALQAQNPHAGNWGGNLFVKNSGVVDLPEVGFGVFLATIDQEGKLRFGVNATSGPVMGTVTDAGKVTFTPPLAGALIETAQITNGVLAGSNTLSFPGLSQIYRVEATRSGDLPGGGDGGGDPLPSGPIFMPPDTQPILDAVSGLYEQALSVIPGNLPLPAFELEIRGVPESVTVSNASRRLFGELIDGRRSVEGYVIDFYRELTGGNDLGLNIQYASLDGDVLPAFTPEFNFNVLESVPEVIKKAFVESYRLSRDQFVFSFPVSSGTRYDLLWSTDLVTWESARSFTAAGSAWEWLADLATGEGARFYQLVEVNP